jgi:hypothetical protein
MRAHAKLLPFFLGVMILATCAGSAEAAHGVRDRAAHTWKHSRTHRMRHTHSRAYPPAVAPVDHSGDNQPGNPYGYVNYNCPAHLTNPYRATPSGFWFDLSGAKRNCF